ncbi:MAG: hypothetical protein ABI415_11835 [Flavitalea sp.]
MSIPRINDPSGSNLPRGNKVVEESKTRILRNANRIMNDLSDDDKTHCIQLLRNVKIKFSSLWQKYPGQSFEDLYKDAMSKYIFIYFACFLLRKRPIALQ